MTMIRKTMPLQSEDITGNRTRVIAATNELARDGHIFEPAGLNTENFLRTGVILFNHDPAIPIATPIAAVKSPDGSSLSVELEWAPEGISPDADRIRGLVKCGVIRAVSISIEPGEMEPLDRQKPRGGQHIKTGEVLELSFVSVPADTGAVVTQRSDQPHVQEDTPDMKTDLNSTAQAVLTRAMAQPMTLILKRGLYEVASLAYLLEQVGYAHACSEWEADVEGDESKVPGMLGEALVKLGAAFIAMSAEEVKELLASKDLEIEEADIVIEERAFVAGGKTPRVRAWRRGVAMARAGKSVSAATQKKLEDGKGHMDRALKHSKTLGDHQGAVAGHMDAITAKQEKANTAHGKLGEALQAAKSDPDKASEHVSRALKQHKAIGGHLADMADEQSNAKDRQLDANDSHEAMDRCVISAQRCMRSVTDDSTVSDDDGDSKEVQTSAGTGESTGSDGSRSLDFRARQADLLRLSSIS